jgi:hypothetical protein
MLENVDKWISLAQMPRSRAQKQNRTAKRLHKRKTALTTGGQSLPPSSLPGFWTFFDAMIGARQDQERRQAEAIASVIAQCSLGQAPQNVTAKPPN